MYTNDNKIYQMKDLESLLEDFSWITSNTKIEYLNVPVAFDIEVSSFYKGDEKRACMYAFVFGINGKCIIARTWTDFLKIMRRLVSKYHLNQHRRMLIYVHNLAYEFQFIRTFFNWKKVFSIDDRKPVYAMTTQGLEFRCSYILSNYSLVSVGNNLLKYKVNKMVGDLDYSLMRHSETPLTKKELGYILNDALVVMSYIQEQIEANHDNISNIPLTNTGNVRRYVSKECFYEGDKKKNARGFKSYSQIIDGLKFTGVDEYKQAKRCFQGGHTHANANYTAKTIEDVTSYDFCSSYPGVMVMEEYPMTTGERISITSREQFEDLLEYNCCMFDVTFYNIEATIHFEHIISTSKCWELENFTSDNGRLVHADKITMTLTDVHYKQIRKFYKWSHFEIFNFYKYGKGYLPSQFVKAILKLYHDKTVLKGVHNAEDELRYAQSKSMLNSCYGMTVTDICKDETIYDPVNDDWIHKVQSDEDIKRMLKKYNNAVKRFLFYMWGIWVCAYAQANLYDGIYNCGDDYIYSDTDSIKIKNVDKHMDYINNYNEIVKVKLKFACEYHKIPFDLVEPTTIKGDKRLLGIWDFDGHYKKFKTLGAKRYLYEDDNGGIHITVAGVNKRVGAEYLKNKYQTSEKIFNAFNDGLVFPKGFSGKNCHTYIDYEIEGDLMDYTGKIGHYHELSAVHMEETEYALSLSSLYLDYLMGIKEGK